MSPIQIILLVIILAIIFKTFHKYRIKNITVREFWLWTFFWAIVAVLVIFPDAMQAVADLVGIGRGVDLFIYLALIAIFAALFFIVVRLERLERDVTKIVRHLAIKKKDDI